MKSLKLLLGVALVGVLALYSGCGPKKGDDPSPSDVQLVKLSKSWKCTSATLNGTAQVPPQADYSNFVLSISGTTGQTTFGYTATSRPIGPWPGSGTFTFGNDVATQVTRDDGLPITYAVTDAQLQLSFTYSGAGFAAGRINQVNGNWIMTFTPQ